MSGRSGIAKSFDKILIGIGYKENGSYNLDTQPKEVADKLGRQLFDYMIASIHDTDWEGFSEEELEGINSFMYDLSLAVEHGS